MAEVDTSSYKLPQSNMLDQATKFQQLGQGAVNLQRSNIALSQDKVKQVNDQFQLMNAELASMADPKAGITKDQAAARLLNLSKTFGFKPEVTNHMMGELRDAPDVPTFARTGILRGQDAIQKFNSIYGTHVLQTNNQQGQNLAISPMTGEHPLGSPFQLQPPPNTPMIDTRPTIDGQENPNYNRPTVLGPRSSIAPPGVATLPGGRPQLPVEGQSAPLPQARPMLPVGKGNLTNDGQVTGIDVGPNQVTPNQSVQNRFKMPSSIATGQAPMFEEGKKQYAADQDNATKLNTTNKPAVLALKMMDGLRSGPGTALWQQALAFGKANGILPTDIKDDPTVVYQTVNKLLHNFIRGSGARSDADLAQLEASNPDLSQHLNQALINLTREQIGLNRVQAARPGAFGTKDYQNYGQHASTFPQSQNEKAYTMDTLPKAEAQKLYATMKAKALAGDPEGIKFIKSLAIAHKQGL